MNYLDPEEEFELMYGNELDLLREQEEEELNLVSSPATCRRSLNFSNNQSTSETNKLPLTTVTSQKDSSTLTAQHSVSSVTSVNTKSLHLSQFDNDIQVIVNGTAAGVATTLNKSTTKRTVSDLFGDIADISDDESDNRVKRPKNDLSDDLALIDHICKVRALKKQKVDFAIAKQNKTTSREEHNKYNLSYEVPRYSFVSVTRSDGHRVYVRCHSERYEKEETAKLIDKSDFAGMMGEMFKTVWKEAEELLNKTLDPPSQSRESLTNPANVSILKQSTESNSDLWVDLYKPKKYVELLSDEYANRTLLRWLKLWDKVVFNRYPKKLIKTPSTFLENKFRNPEIYIDLDEHGRPRYKIVLLCGPPGLGKTTLAHTVAKHAGYNVVEVNASDDRTVEKFKTVLENSTQMKSVVHKDKRPNCLVFDEIDGAPSAAIDYLVKYVNRTPAVKGKKGENKSTQILKRPIICICNDVYVPALRALRQIALIVKFPPTASDRLAERLQEIAKYQKIKTDYGAMLALSEKSGNDIRSCLSVLHFFKALNKAITLSQVHKTNVGQKDIQKGLFSVWQEIFTIQKPKHVYVLPGESRENVKQNYHSLQNRMQRVLQVVNAFGDFNRLSNGVFENYLSVKIQDSTLNGICEAMEWFCYTDILNQKILELQNYSLGTYLPYAFVVWHFVFGSFSFQKLNYPSTDYVVKTKLSTNKALVQEIMKTMSPSSRAFTYSNSLRLDILPILSAIIVPKMRHDNLNLFSQHERDQLNNVVSIMVDYNLTYIQERTPDGVYVFNMDPNLDEITCFPGSKRRFLSYANKQLIAHEVEVKKMHLNISRETKSDGKKKANDVKENNVNKPPLSKKDVNKVKRPKNMFIIGGKAAGTETHFYTDIWYQYKEGYNNAVRKKIKISSLL